MHAREGRQFPLARPSTAEVEIAVISKVSFELVSIARRERKRGTIEEHTHRDGAVSLTYDDRNCTLE